MFMLLYVLEAKAWPICLSLLDLFFQAEDGIRDYKVTGVQTCALPICRQRIARVPGRRHYRSLEETLDRLQPQLQPVQPERVHVFQNVLGRARHPAKTVRRKIGRASCRERV